MLWFDRSVFREMDGLIRLYFEERDLSTSAYLYVWLNSDLRIVGFQMIGGFGCYQIDKHGEHHNSSISLNRIPFNRATTGPAYATDHEIIEALSHFSSKEFPTLMENLVQMVKKERGHGEFTVDEKRFLTDIVNVDTTGRP